MAEIRKYFWVRHLRSEPTSHVLHYRRGKLVRKGRGASFWFQALHSSIAEVPIDTRELPFVFQGKSSDFQEVTVQGDISYRIVNPERISEMIDFSIDLGSGTYLRKPLEQIASIIVGQCQQIAVDLLLKYDIRSVLSNGPTVVKDALESDLQSSHAVNSLGIDILSIRVSDISPIAELGKALLTPTREHIQQQADEATFSRRALAVEKERAIEENELNNRIELARKEQLLIEQTGLNRRKDAEEHAAAEKVTVESEAEQTRVKAESQANSIRVVKGAEINAEKDRIEQIEGAQIRAETDRVALIEGAKVEAETARVEMIETARVKAEKDRVEQVEGARVLADRDRVEFVDNARINGEIERLNAYGNLPPAVLLGLAAQELAAKLSKVDHITITPDMLANGLSRVMEIAGVSNGAAND